MAISIGVIVHYIILFLLLLSGQRSSRSCLWALNIATSDRKDYEWTKRNEYTIYPKVDYYTREEDLIEKDLDGYKRLCALIDTLDKCDKIVMPRSAKQRQMHREFVIACIRKIMGDDMNRYLPLLIKQFGITDIRPDLILSTPRREGKTTAVAIYASCLLISQPGCTVTIYSTGGRASKKLLALIYRIIIKFMTDEKIDYNQDLHPV